MGVVWFGNCEGTEPGGRISGDLSWPGTDSSRPVDQERREILERRGGRGGIGFRVAVDRVDDDAGPQNDRQAQVDLELIRFDLSC